MIGTAKTRVSIIWLAFAILVATPANSEAQALAVGSRIKVEGQWTGEYFRADRVQYRDSRRDPLGGRAAGLVQQAVSNGREFQIGPVTVEWTEETELEELTATELSSGRTVEAIGRLIGPGRLLANRIEPGPDEGRPMELLGSVTKAERRSDGALDIELLGVPVRVEASISERERVLTSDLDDKRPDEQLTLDLWGRSLVIGGEVGLRIRGESDFDFEDRGRRARLDTETELEFLYRLGKDSLIFLEGKASYERELDRDRPTETLGRRGESWIFFPLGASGLSLQIGRQAFREEREWWWDGDLDAIRLRWERFPFGVSFAVAQELAGVSAGLEGFDPEDREITRFLGRGSVSYLSDHQLDVFAIVHNDHSKSPELDELVSFESDDESDAELTWFGMRFSGELDLEALGEADYWLDAARVSGDETVFKFDDSPEGALRVESKEQYRVEGWGIDAGVTWEFPLRGDPTFTISGAFGTGPDDASVCPQCGFRQTGLHDNNGRYRGVNRFRYYGELLRPELSNLSVLTASFGFQFLDSSSAEITAHRYRQDTPASFLRDARLDSDPLGLRPGLGEELDFTVGLEEWEHLEIELIGAVFRAGPAFGSARGELAGAFFLKFDINF